MIISISLMRELRLREVQKLSLGHTASVLQPSRSWDHRWQYNTGSWLPHEKIK